MDVLLKWKKEPQFIGTKIVRYLWNLFKWIKEPCILPVHHVMKENGGDLGGVGEGEREQNRGVPHPPRNLERPQFGEVIAFQDFRIHRGDA